MLWLAWKIANAAAPADAATTGKPLTFVEAALFQWMNPKAWTMALTAIAVDAPNRDLAAVALVAAIFGAVQLPSVSSWAALGTVMRRWLRSPVRLRR